MTPRLHSARPIQRAAGFVDRPPRRPQINFPIESCRTDNSSPGPSFRASARRCRLETEEGVRMKATMQKGLPRPPRSFQASGRSDTRPASPNAAPIQETPFRSARLGPSWLCRPCSFNSTTREHLNPRRAQVVEPTTCAQSARRGPPLPQFHFTGMAGWHVAALSATSSLRSATAPRSPSRCPTTTSARPSASLPSRPPSPHNQPNRRVRTRMHGGVGGEGPRGSPFPDVRKILPESATGQRARAAQSGS